MRHHAVAGTVAADPMALLALGAACDDAAGHLGRVATGLGAVTLAAGPSEAWAFRTRATSAWLRDQARDVRRRALALPEAPGVGAAGWSTSSAWSWGPAWDAWDEAAGRLLRGSNAALAAWGAVGGAGDLRDIRRSTAWVERARRQADAFGALPGVTAAGASGRPGGGGGVAGRLAAAEGELAAFGRVSQVTDDVVPWLRTADGVLGAWGIVGDVHTILDPPHDGWYGTADQAVAATSLAAGVAQFGALSGLVALTPAGATAIGVIAIGAGAYAVGSYVYDHRREIGAALGRARDAVGGAAGAVGDAAGAVGGAVGDAATAGGRVVATAYDWSAEQLGSALDGVGGALDGVGGALDGMSGPLGRAFGFGS